MTENGTTPIEVQLAIDDYGSYARASYFADYLEFRAILGSRMPMSQLVDMILQNDWGRRDLTLATTSEFEEPFDEAEDFDDEEDSIASRIESVLRQRLALSARYPFSVEHSGRSATVVHQDFEEGELYLHLLALTLAHTNNIQVDGLDADTVEDAFEELVARALEERGIPSVVVPTYGKYEDKIGPAVQPIGLSPHAGLASRSKRAKDGGTDIVCNPPGSDPRSAPGFLLLGQATCGTTETWPTKAKQPDVAAWRRMLRMDWDPQRFLAVPHHVDQQYWSLLAQDSECVVMDRLRIAAMGSNTTPDSGLVMKAVFG